MSNVDGSYSANSQELTFIESDFVGAENTQATEFNYELTFPNDQNNFQTQTQHSQMDHMMTQSGAGGLGLHSQVRSLFSMLLTFDWRLLVLIVGFVEL